MASAFERPKIGAVAALGLIAAALAFDPRAGSAQTPKVALLVGVSLAWLALDLPRWWRAETQPLRTGPLMALLLAGWLLVSLGWSSHPDPTAASLWVAIAAIGIAMGGLGPATRRRSTGRIAVATVVGASGAVILQAALGAEGIGRHGLMGNPNWLGLSLAAALPLVVGHAVEQRGLERSLAAVAAALGLVGLAIAQSRVALVALMAAAFASALAARPKQRRTAAGVLAAILTLASALALTTDLGADLASSLEGRLWLGQVGLDAWQQAPLIGHGQGSLTEAFLTAQGDRLALLELDEASRRFVYVTTAHDDWLELAIAGGLVALALGIALWAVALIDLRRWPAGLASLVAIGVGMVGDAPLHQPAVAVVLGLVLAETRPLPRARRRSHDAAIVAGMLAALGALLPRAATGWLAERRATGGGAPTAQLVALEQAQAMAPFHGEIALELGLARLRLGDVDGALAAFEEARQAGLASLALPLAEGNARLRAGRSSEAIAAYRGALGIHPASFVAHANLAEAHRREGALDEARRHLRAARELQPHHPKLAAIEEALRRDDLHEATSAAASR